jgi:uncharacterized protein DUF4382
MRRPQRGDSHRPIIFLLLAASLPVILAAALISCGGFTTTGMQSNGTGTITVSMTDPPTCKTPEGNFLHVYVTIRSVQANISGTADDNSSGWVELAPQLNSAPMQIDLLSQPATTCLLATLGTNTALPAGTYQQIRLLLVPNSGGTGPTPATNNCQSPGFNCVQLSDQSFHELLLSSQANTGLKIPPGQIVGGPISVAAGQDVDLNIDFNTCASIIVEGNGSYRLKPVLTAEQVTTNTTGISGQVVDQTTSKPVVGGTVIVALEKPDSTGTDVIFEEANADSFGNFNFCPLPSGATFDVVVVAINGAGTAYNATVAVGVPGGTSLGAIPLYPETGTATSPATFQGIVTATTGSAPAKIDVLVSAIQAVSATLSVTIPPEAASTPPSGTNLSVDSPTSCPASVSTMTHNCAQYTLIVPASNPSVGTFSSGTIPPISYSTPVAASSGVPYSIRADAFMPMMGGTTDCMPSSVTVTMDSSMPPMPLKALPSPPSITPMEIDFKGCT